MVVLFTMRLIYSSVKTELFVLEHTVSKSEEHFFKRRMAQFLYI